MGFSHPGILGRELPVRPRPKFDPGAIDASMRLGRHNASARLPVPFWPGAHRNRRAPLLAAERNKGLPRLGRVQARDEHIGNDRALGREWQWQLMVLP